MGREEERPAQSEEKPSKDRKKDISASITKGSIEWTHLSKSPRIQLF